MAMTKRSIFYTDGLARAFSIIVCACLVTFIMPRMCSLRHSRLKAWLFRVATNQCYRIFRKFGKEIEFSESRFQARISNPGPDLIREMRMQKILSKLPENQRVVIVLKFYENLTYADIADVLCCPLGTVKSRMHEGISNLRRRLHGMRECAKIF
jgi:RNA polymerase sigma factor (sigma-70 family)